MSTKAVQLMSVEASSQAFAEAISYDVWEIALASCYDETAAPKFIKDLVDKVANSKTLKIIETFIGHLREFVFDVADHIGVTVREVAMALANKDVYALFKAFAFNTVKIAKTIHKGAEALKNAYVGIFAKILASGMLDDVKKGVATMDDVLNKYPILKKLAGPALAGVLILMWLNMSFTGNFDYDMDVSHILAALAGSFTLTDLFMSPDGLASLGLLCANFASGGALNATAWLGANTYNLILAFVYTGIVRTPALKTLVSNVKAKVPLGKFKVNKDALKLV